MEEHLFERLARERGITVEEMREIISARIEKGWNDPDQEKREHSYAFASFKIWQKYGVHGTSVYSVSFYA